MGEKEVEEKEKRESRKDRTKEKRWWELNM